MMERQRQSVRHTTTGKYMFYNLQCIKTVIWTANTYNLWDRNFRQTQVLGKYKFLYSATLTDIFTALLLTTQAANWVIQGMQITFYIGLCVFLYFAIQLSRCKKRLSVWQYSEWLTLVLSSIILEPLLHFGLYFCLLHSPKHLQDIGVKLHGSVKRAIAISIPFVILTIILAAGLYELFASRELNIDLLRWIFIGLFGLTMSHMLLIHLWHRAD